MFGQNLFTNHELKGLDPKTNFLRSNNLSPELIMDVSQQQDLHCRTERNILIHLKYFRMKKIILASIIIAASSLVFLLQKA